MPGDRTQTASPTAAARYHGTDLPAGLDLSGGTGMTVTPPPGTTTIGMAWEGVMSINAPAASEICSLLARVDLQKAVL